MSTRRTAEAESSGKAGRADEAQKPAPDVKLGPVSTPGGEAAPPIGSGPGIAVPARTGDDLQDQPDAVDVGRQGEKIDQTWHRAGGAAPGKAAGGDEKTRSSADGD